MEIRGLLIAGELDSEGDLEIQAISWGDYHYLTKQDIATLQAHLQKVLEESEEE